MKTITINSLGWIKAFFMAANPVTNSRTTVYRSKASDNNKTGLQEENNTIGEQPTKPELADIMRTAHRGNFSSGPTFLFHPGWFK
jgi:hypothetical protein